MQLPYLRRRVALWRRENRSPRFLYKFRALQRPNPSPQAGASFTDESIERLRAILVRSLLRLSSPDELNDPFELAARWIIEGTVQERFARFRALTREQIPNAGFKERERATAKLMEASEADLLPLVRKSFIQQRSGFGICCFAGRDPANVLMWSHYADEHRGICLQFELARDLPVFMRAVTVDYIDEYPTINWIAPNWRGGIGGTFTRKHTRWKYEGEHRILSDGAARTFVKFEPGALTGVIFGCRADQTVKYCVGRLLQERANRQMPAVQLYYARQNPRRYELDIWS
jgi:hypothetical protein